jgi:hypothetical protein
LALNPQGLKKRKIIFFRKLTSSPFSEHHFRTGFQNLTKWIFFVSSSQEFPLLSFSGFRLYDDLKTCVLTEELLEEAVQEMTDFVEFPVVIVLLAGFLGTKLHQITCKQSFL